MNPFEGYFPIPNLRNRDRLIWDINNHEFNIPKSQESDMKNFIMSLPEDILSYMHLTWHMQDRVMYINGYSLNGTIDYSGLRVSVPSKDRNYWSFHRDGRDESIKTSKVMTDEFRNEVIKLFRSFYYEHE